MHVLLVEDRHSYADRWSGFLKHAGHTVALATSYDEAIAEFNAQRPDLIICDNDLNACATYTDGLDTGYFFLAKVRKNGFAEKIIFYTRNPRSYFEGELSLETLGVRFIRKRQ